MTSVYGYQMQQSVSASFVPQYVPSTIARTSSGQMPADSHVRPNLRLIKSTPPGFVYQPLPMNSPSSSPSPSAGVSMSDALPYCMPPTAPRKYKSVSFSGRTSGATSADEQNLEGLPSLWNSVSAPVKNDRRSTRPGPCFRMLRNGFCDVPNCRFYHVDPRDVDAERSDNRPPCVSFIKRGVCNDAKCAYRHDTTHSSRIAEPKIDVNGLVPAHEPEENERKLCYDFANKGVCKYGAHCRYTHIQRVCYEFVNKGTCSREARGEKCKYLHTADQKFQLCPEFLRTGKCQRQGKGCRFKHEKRNSQRKKEEQKDSRIGVEIAKSVPVVPSTVDMSSRASSVSAGTVAGGLFSRSATTTPALTATPPPSREVSPIAELPPSHLPTTIPNNLPMMTYTPSGPVIVYPAPPGEAYPTGTTFPLVYSYDPNIAPAPIFAPMCPATMPPAAQMATAPMPADLPSASPSMSLDMALQFPSQMTLSTCSDASSLPSTKSSPDLTAVAAPLITTTYKQPAQAHHFLTARCPANSSTRSLPVLSGFRKSFNAGRTKHDTSLSDNGHTACLLRTVDLAFGSVSDDSDDEGCFVSCEEPEGSDMTFDDVVVDCQ